MRASTYASHRQRIGRAVSHIDLCLDEDIDVRKLADIACFSPFHFLRVFQELTEETPLAMVRRLRLERACKLLLAGSSVREAADEARFESTQAFGRAFRSEFGITPSRAASSGIGTPAAAKPPAIVSLQDRRAISVDFNGMGAAISDEFGHLLALTRPLVKRFPSAIAMATQDDPFAGPHVHYSCRMLVMLSPDGLRETKLPMAAVDGGLYAIWQRQGPLNESRAAYERLVHEWLPAHGYRKSEAPVMRVYHNDPALVPGIRRRWAMLVPVVPSAT